MTGSSTGSPKGSIDRAWFEVQERVQRHHWWYRGRRALLSRLVPRLLRRDRRARILDVGSGVGVNARLLARFGDVVLVDESPEALSRARAGSALPCCRGDAVRLPFRDGAFDLACALDVLEHLEDDEGALRELARVIAPGGRLLIMVPAFDFLWGPQDDVSHHVRRYRRAEIVERVRAAGFRHPASLVLQLRALRADPGRAKAHPRRRVAGRDRERAHARARQPHPRAPLLGGVAALARRRLPDRGLPRPRRRTLRASAVDGGPTFLLNTGVRVSRAARVGVSPRRPALPRAHGTRPTPLSPPRHCAGEPSFIRRAP